MKLGTRQRKTIDQILRLITYLQVVILLLIGFFGGELFIAWTKGSIKYDPTVDLVGLLTLIVTFLLAISVPIFLQKNLGDKRAIKSFVTSELMRWHNELSFIVGVLDSSVNSNSLTSQQITRINHIFFSADLLLESIQNQFEISFPKISLEEIKDSYFKLWGSLTSNQFSKATQAFHVNDAKAGITYVRRFQNEIIILVHQVNID